MKHIYALVAFACAFAGSVQAQTAAKWEGAFVGASMRLSANDEAENFALDSSGFGLYAGYNLQRDKFVIGGELSTLTASGENDAEGRFMFFKGRIGYDLGNTLPYVLVGQSEVDGSFPRYEFNSNAFVLGAGVTYQISEWFTVGFEVTHAEYKDIEVSDRLPTFDYSSTLMSLRTGFRF